MQLGRMRKAAIVPAQAAGGGAAADRHQAPRAVPRRESLSRASQQPRPQRFHLAAVHVQMSHPVRLSANIPEV